MIGRHYLVRSLDKQKRFSKNKRRQYTIANCMEAKTYKAYIEALKGAGFDKEVLD
jgi:hypothetical protein